MTLKLGVYKPNLLLEMYHNMGTVSSETNIVSNYEKDPDGNVYGVNNYLTSIGLSRDLNDDKTNIVIDVPSGKIKDYYADGELPFNNSGASPYQYVVELMETTADLDIDKGWQLNLRDLVIPQVPIVNNWKTKGTAIREFNLQLPVRFKSNYSYGIYVGPRYNNNPLLQNDVLRSLYELFRKVSTLSNPFGITIIVNSITRNDNIANIVTPIINQAKTAGLDDKWLNILLIKCNDSVDLSDAPANVFVFDQGGWNHENGINDKFKARATGANWIVSDTTRDKTKGLMYNSFLHFEKTTDDYVSDNISYTSDTGFDKTITYNMPIITKGLGQGENNRAFCAYNNLRSQFTIGVAVDDLNSGKVTNYTNGVTSTNNDVSTIVNVAKVPTNNVNIDSDSSYYGIKGYSVYQSLINVNNRLNEINFNHPISSNDNIRGSYTPLIDLTEANDELFSKADYKKTTDAFSGAKIRMDSYGETIKQIGLNTSNTYITYNGNPSNKGYVIIKNIDDAQFGNNIFLTYSKNIDVPADHNETVKDLTDTFVYNTFNKETYGTVSYLATKNDTPVNPADQLTDGEYNFVVKSDAGNMLELKVTVKKEKPNNGYNIHITLIKGVIDPNAFANETWWS